MALYYIMYGIQLKCLGAILFSAVSLFANLFTICMDQRAPV